MVTTVAIIQTETQITCSSSILFLLVVLVLVVDVAVQLKSTNGLNVLITASNKII